jgi:hypothetical protein
MRRSTFDRFLSNAADFIGSDRFMIYVVVAMSLMYAPLYFFSPQWATDAGLGTRELYDQRAVAECEKLIDKEIVTNVTVIHDTGQPISPEALADWTPQRVEARYDSGLAVVSTLGQNGNLQYVVRDLDLPVGAVFRNWNGQVKEVL